MFCMAKSFSDGKYWSFHEWTAGPIRDEPHSTYRTRFALLIYAVPAMITETRFQKDEHGEIRLRIVSREDVQWHLGHMVMEASTPEEVTQAIHVAKQVEAYRVQLLEMLAEVEDAMKFQFMDRDARRRVRNILDQMDQMDPGAEEFYRQQNFQQPAVPMPARETVDPNFDPFA